MTIIANYVAWSRSGPNREARRIAHRKGERPPPMRHWTRAVYILVPSVLFVVVLLVQRRIVPR